jgi:4-diphosphocytidyl-2-C-methyl-D-erythritol kinase
MKLKSFAKINLGLEVLGRRPDGYHEIRTLFQSVDFHDEIEFEEAGPGVLSLEGDDPSVPWDERNLIHRAALVLRGQAGREPGVRIRVRKRIPAGAGLGGGSSNAAVTLLALNRLWRVGLGRSGLQALAARLGSDVAYFLEGGLCLGEGRGERLSPLEDLPRLYGVIVLPPVVSLTAEVYRRFRPSLTSRVRVSKMNRFLRSREIGSLENRLESTVFRLYPQLKDIKRFFRSRGAALSLVTGSGSAVFGLFRSREEAERGWTEARERHPSVLVETLSRGEYGKGLSAGV